MFVSSILSVNTLITFAFSLGLINGAHDVLLNRFLPGGRGLSYMNELKLTPRQVNEMLETTEEVLEYSNKYGNVGTEIPLCAI